MEYRRFGDLGFDVSRLSFGASALGSVFREVNESDAIAAVHAALDAGINYIDVAPAYGATKSEGILGKALRGIPRNRYHISTKVGKKTDALSVLAHFILADVVRLHGEEEMGSSQ